MGESLNFFKSYFLAGEKLPDEERLKLYDKVLRFYFDNDDSEIDGTAGAVWEGIKPVVKNSKTKSENGKKGGAPKNNKNAVKTGTPEDFNNQKTSKKQANDNQKTSKNKPIGKGVGKGKGIGDGEGDNINSLNADNKSSVSSHEGISDINFFLAEKSNPRAKGINPRNVSALTAMIDERNFSQSVNDTLKEWLKYKLEKKQGYKPTGFASLLSIVENQVKAHGEKPVIDLINLSMSNNWQGVAWDKLKQSRASPAFDGNKYLESVIAGGNL